MKSDLLENRKDYFCLSSGKKETDVFAANLGYAMLPSEVHVFKTKDIARHCRLLAVRRDIFVGKLRNSFGEVKLEVMLVSEKFKTYELTSFGHVVKRPCLVWDLVIDFRIFLDS